MSTDTTTAPPSAAQVFAAIQEQRSRLYNVEHAVGCARAYVSLNSICGVEGALQLIEQEVSRINEALEECNLERAITESEKAQSKADDGDD